QGQADFQVRENVSRFPYASFADSMRRQSYREEYRTMTDPKQQTHILYRPVGPKELALIEASGWRSFPPRLLDQPIFYPVLTEEYAVKIARDWNVPSSGAGFVTRFAVARSYLDKYRIEEAGGRDHLEYWIPAEDLQAFNAAIVGLIEVIASFGAAGHPVGLAGSKG
ncbi:MAG TPA: hypothetical protein VN229_14070, partial [Terriglobales bacterium]|nr:hypothetical protein [Terriglobales bacterium]